MFNYIFPKQDFDAVPATEIISQTELDHRKDTIKNFITELYYKTHLRTTENFIISYFSNPFELIPAAGLITIYMPRLLLLTQSDFGSEFQGISNLEEFDKRLEADPHLMQKFSDRLATILGREKISVTYEHREAVRLMIRYITKDPQLAIEGFRFIILHELGHLYHHHSTRPILHQKRWMAMGALSFAMLIFSIAFALGITGWGIFIVIPVAFAVAGVAAKIIQAGCKVLHSRVLEREADAFAMSAVDGEEGKKIRAGGIYLFQTLREHQIELRNNSQIPFKERFIFRLLFSSEGNNRFLYFTHPSEQERIQNIKRLSLD